MRIKHVLRFLIVDLIKGVCERSLRASTMPCLALIYKYKYVWGPETCSFTDSYLDWLIIMASSASKYSSLPLLGLMPASCCFFQMLRPRVASAQNCECSSGLCCTGNDYCGDGCKQGPCYHANSSPTATSNANVASIITKDFFDGILAEADSSCAGKNFYTYGAFIAAANDKAFSGFGTTGTPDDSKRELAAFFAHVTHETRHFCYIEEIDGPQKDYCDESNTQYPCVSGKGYYGRGPIQLSWNYNYGPAGQDIGFDGLNEPEKVAEDASISFKTAVWYWMIHSDCHSAITSGKGFGATIRAINGRLECEGGPGRDAVATRIGYYQNYCQQLGVDPGDNLSC